MTTDYRALCAELVDLLHEHTCLYEGHESELVTRARALLAEPVAECEPMPLPGDAEGLAEVFWAQPVAEGPTDEEMTQLLFDGFRGPIEFICDDEEVAHLMIRSHVKFARAVLDRWGHQ